MSFTRFPIRLSILCLTLGAASNCAAPASVSPPAADLVPPAKPVPSEEIATSQAAYETYQAAIEDYADAEHDQLKRICVWSNSVWKLRLDCGKR
jgi:hypothetical protein